MDGHLAEQHDEPNSSTRWRWDRRKGRGPVVNQSSSQIFSTMGDGLGDYSRSAMASPMADVDSCCGVATRESD